MIMVRRAACTLLVLLLAACGSDDPNPGPKLDYGPYRDTFSNTCALCDGCCQNGQCMPGNAITACGIGGLACRECFTGQSCVNGTCINQGSTCSTTCDGCCTSTGQCINPGTDQNCGINGLPCQACGADRTCDAGACRSTAPSIISVAVVSAQVSNSDCSLTGYTDDCDPFVIMRLGNGQDHTSSWIEDTETPTWTDAKIDVERTRLLSEVLHVEVWDDDDITGHDELGKCDISVKEADLTAGELTTTCDDAQPNEPRTQNLKITFTAASN